MNRLILNIVSVVIFAGAFVSCKKNNFAVDQNIVPPSFAKFNVKAIADTIKTYYVKSTNEPFKIPIGVTTVSENNRTVQLTYSSRTAVAGTQYSAPTSIVIPAGKAVDTLAVQGLFAGYTSSTRRDTLDVKIAGGDVAASSYWNNFRLILRRYCRVDLPSLSGAYTNVMDNGNYGPYPMTVTAGAVVDSTATITVANLWDPGVPVTTTVRLNWTDDGNFTTTIPDQVYYGAANWWIVGTTAGTFSACDQSFTLRYRLYNKATGAILYNNQVTVIRR
jgi:hypothetical protein